MFVPCTRCSEAYNTELHTECPSCFPGAKVHADLKVDGSSGDPATEAAMLRAFAAAFTIWKVRHRKYGRTNIARTGDVGCYVRIEDKISRLERWYKRNTDESFADETLVDTWIDILNYAAMGLLSVNKEWPS